MLDAITDQLYALPPEEFTAARDALRREHRDLGREIQALRKPSVSAWLVNRLAREQAEVLAELLSLGPALAQAQQERSASDLRELGGQRRALVEAVTEQAVRGASRPVSAAVRDEIASTLETALADPASADAVRGGRLIRALSYAGFGGVDLAGAVAAGPTGGAPTRAKASARPAQQPGAREVAAAERAAQEAAGALDDAVRAWDRAVARKAEAVQAETERAVAVADAERALVAAQTEYHAAAAEVDQAAAEAERGQSAVARAQERAERTRTALDQLRRT